MDTLKNNLNNYSLLPYDVMNLIYEFADPLKKLPKQIENKEYDLDEIMYRRMKKHIIKREFKYRNSYIIIGWNFIDTIEINDISINDIKYKNHLLNEVGGYKQLFLSKVKRLTYICGLNPKLKDEYSRIMTLHTHYSEAYTKNPYSYRSNTLKEFYQDWVKL